MKAVGQLFQQVFWQSRPLPLLLDIADNFFRCRYNRECVKGASKGTFSCKSWPFLGSISGAFFRSTGGRSRLQRER
ncbi:hypothetical protein HMPREF0262_02632 [Clostridium sp. ATCC 29733]|nr:hypothetical protein HMPREF0262_02632 [Clostridium sp. ATCC 29733]